MAGCLLLLALCISACARAQVRVWLKGEDGPILVKTSKTTPVDIIAETGISLEPEDGVYLNSERIDPQQPINLILGANLFIRRAFPITVLEDGREFTFKSSALTLGEALWEQAIFLSASDYLSLPASTTIEQPLEVTIRHSVPFCIQVDGQELSAPSSAETIGQALANAGVSLQHLDYSIPAEDEPVPVDGVIKVVRVREELLLEQTAVPFEKEYVTDAEMELDQLKILEGGEYGMQISRVRVRYENDQEVARQMETEWLAKTPKPQKIAYGTKVVIRTVDTPSGPLEYWRAIGVWITSYHETGSKTSSGTWPVKGDIAVNLDWYRLMKGQRVYVPGYVIGVISDVCPGCVGKPWIDIFLPDEEYVLWHQTSTVYFLTPAPASIPYILP